MFLVKLIDLYTYVVLASVIVSWIPVSPDNPIVKFINSSVEPVLAPIRRILPAAGGLDFSPLVLLVLLRVLQRAVLAAL